MEMTLVLAAAMTLVMTEAQASPVAFANGSKSNYNGCTRITEGEAAGDFTVTSTKDEKATTAWGYRSEKIRIPSHSASYALAFEVRAEKTDWIQPDSFGDKWGNSIRWLDSAGNLLSRRLLNVEFRAGRNERFRFTGAIPKGATSVEINFGVDAKPTVLPGERIEFRHVTFDCSPKNVKPPRELKADLNAPIVTSAFTSPSTDENLAVRYAITDYTAVDWSAVVVSDKVTKATIPFVRSGDMITLKPGAPWAKGVHSLTVAVRDTVGNAEVSEKAFLIGEAPKAKRVTLRDDGVTLIDGAPFYPIGIYGIKPHEFNGNSFDKAIGDLMAAGLNTGHAYQYRWDPDFLAAAAKHGMKLWTDGKCALKTDGFFVDSLRNDPSTIAWYIGDDTSMNTTPGQLHDRDEACRMLDGTRLTCHADGVRSQAAKSNYEEYVPYADVFLPEIYPFDNYHDERCVAEVCRDMDRCWSDIRKFSGGRTCGVWAILQCFHGKSWLRYPTTEEMYATSFAAVVHGATGMTWFHYQGSTDDPKKSYSGMFNTPETWACMTNITHRIAALTPVLLERTPAQPPVPEVVSGPKADPLGQPSVTALMKIHNDDIYLLAVNAATNSVRAKFQVPGIRTATGKVAWEHRTVSLARGEFEDDFDVLGVHVYRFQKP